MLLKDIRDWRDLTSRQVEAYLIATGGNDPEVIRAVLKREKTVELVDSQRKLCTKHGLWISHETNRDLWEVDYDFIPNVSGLKRTPDELVSSGFFYKFGRQFTFSNFAELLTETQRLAESLKRDSLLSNVLHGPFLPVYLPKVESGGCCHETFLKEKLFPAVEKFYQRAFQGSRKQLSFQRTLASSPQSNYGQFLQKLDKSPRTGLFFLAPFEGYSAESVWKQVELVPLPAGFSLPGILEIVMLVCMYGSAFRPGSGSCSFDAAGLQLVVGAHNVSVPIVSADSPKWIQLTDDSPVSLRQTQNNIRGLIYTGES